MAEFLPKKELHEQIYNLFNEAEEELIIVSPYIKLHPNIKKLLLKKKNDENFEIKLLFGKNETDKSKSLSSEDIMFFKEFKNIEIYYNENLHAKYYANESISIITSLNLHEYSIDNNIEVGVLFKKSLIGSFANIISDKLGKDSQADALAFNYFDDLFKRSEKVFKQYTEQKSFLLGIIKGKSETNIAVDNTSKIYEKNDNLISNQKDGYCIRTGIKIPFNIKKPYCDKAFESWSKFKNNEYSEKYCHFSGELSAGQTCMSKPVLKKYYNLVK